MRFSKLVSSLRNGSSGLLEHFLAQDPEIHNGASIEKAGPNEISFLEEGSHLCSSLNSTKADVLLLPPNLKDKVLNEGFAWAIVDNPRLAFAECLELLNPNKFPKIGVHPTAVIENEVIIGDGVSIGANVFIGEGSHIGSQSIIHPGVVVYENVIIGESNELHANAVIHRRTEIGCKCIIHSNAVIGSEGFGFVPSKDGWRKMPQTGIVVIEDLVEVGCGTTIDRPSVGETRIGSGTKLDNLIQIGHGVKLGQGCALAAQVGIAGGAQLGNGVILAGQVGISNRVVVGNNVIASSKTGIISNVEDGNVVSGFPAIPNRLWLKCVVLFNKLPELAKTIRGLKKFSPE